MFKNTFRIGLVFSVALHLSFFLFLQERTPEPPKSSETIEITLQDLDSFKQLDEQETPSKQIVEQDEQQLNDEIDEKAKFLGRHNQRVVRETKAQAHGKLNNTSAGQMAATPSPQKNHRPEAKEKNSPAAQENGQLPTLADLKPKFDWNQVENQGRNPAETQVSQQSDYLREIEEGPQTLLSTREFVYYSYYSRIKSRLQQYWEPSIKKKLTHLFKSGRGIASSSDKVTQLVIVLNQKGILQKVQVVSTSGVQDLDDAAIEAFRSAAPFPNPPQGIVEEDGTIRIRWDFVLEA